MTSYSGPLTGGVYFPIRDPLVGPNGEVPSNHVSNYMFGRLSGSITLTDVTVDAAGTVTGFLFASGSLYVERFTNADGTTSRTTSFLVPATLFTTTLDNFSLPLDAIDSILTLSPTSADSFGEGRLTLAINQGASFVYDDPTGPLLSTFSLQTTLQATSSAYAFIGFHHYGAETSGQNIAEGTQTTNRVALEVFRRGGLDSAVTVAWSVRPAAATSGADFVGGVLPSGILSFAPGEDRKSIFIDIATDHDYEDSAEGFQVVLAPPPGELLTYYNPITHTIWIRNDDAMPVVGIKPLDADKLEGDEGTTPFTFLLTRTGNTLTKIDIPWSATAWETALAPGQPAKGNMHFAEGETEQVLTILIAADRVVEPDRRLIVSLDYSAGYQRGDDQAAGGNIRTDDTDIDGIVVVESASGAVRAVAPAFYSGPVGGVEKELILISPENLNMAASGPNWFMHTGSGNDAIAAHSGTNLLDGGTGSNFLTGGSGVDHFFIDARGLAAPVWSTVLTEVPLDYQGESVTIWVDDLAAISTIWEDHKGAPGYQGLTLHVGAPGRRWASLTLPGYDKSHLDRAFKYREEVRMWSGTTSGENGSDFLYINMQSVHLWL